jgi:hypothetical protein
MTVNLALVMTTVMATMVDVGLVGINRRPGNDKAAKRAVLQSRINNSYASRHPSPFAKLRQTATPSRSANDIHHGFQTTSITVCKRHPSRFSNDIHHGFPNCGNLPLTADLCCIVAIPISLYSAPTASTI